ncbi:MAG: radical SAM protein [Rickettsia sp.]|nr:radical SAM protein [Rickettsia sp.]
MQAGIVLKTVERCNINCTYCYFFNKKDQSFQLRKPYISKKTLDIFIDFVKKGIKQLKITHLTIGFHGGEPLMQKKKDFVEMCRSIQQKLTTVIALRKVNFTIQTNGILIDEEWITIFKKYNIGVGISLDGTQEVNDKFRVDKSGRGTYSKVVKKIKLCRENNFNIGILAVVNPLLNGQIVFKHFVETLKQSHFDFLIPDANYLDLPTFPIQRYGEFMSEVFIAWSSSFSKDKKVFVRFCLNILELFFGSSSRVEGYGKRDKNTLPLICVSNNGDLGPLDELRSCVPELFLKYNIQDISWKKYLSEELFFKEYLYNMNNSPQDCRSCCWEKICKGGAYVHRYDKNTGFLNKSVYCEALKYFYEKVTFYLLQNGYVVSDIKKFLSI